MNEITYLDGPVLRPLFKLLRKTHLADPLLELLLKASEYYANGPHTRGRFGTGRIKWSSFKTLLLTGQSHLDAAWRWRLKQGIIKARATFKKALDHIADSSLGGFTFSQPSPLYYDWMKRYFPEIFDGIKKAVKEGKWIPLGGSWVEMDTNLPCGESLVRQRLYGQRFYMNEFSFTADVELLADCFGFNGNLPQILSKSGAKMFATNKLYWNKTEKFPFGMFIWKGIDGSTVPAFMVQFGYFMPIVYGKDYPEVFLLGKRGRKITASYITPPEEIRKWRSREYMWENIFAYGLGDGGHGPIELELLIVNYLRFRYPKIFRYTRRNDFILTFSRYFDRWAVWNDELYLDLHRGTYTSVCKVKRGNRETEIILETAEKMAIITGTAAEPLYNREAFEECWKKVLTAQFHDILPGSSIPEVYIDYMADYKKVTDFAGNLIGKITRSVISKLKGEADVYKIPIFNPLSFGGKKICRIYIENSADSDHGIDDGFILRDHNGKIIPYAVIEPSYGTKLPPSFGDRIFGIGEGARKKGVNSMEPNGTLKKPTMNGYGKVILFGADLPPCGFALFRLEKGKKEPPETDKRAAEVTVKEDTDKIILANGKIETIIEKKSGTVISLKKESKEFIFGDGIRPRVYREDKGADAWNIDPEYKQKPLEINTEGEGARVIYDGPVFGAVRTVYGFGGSKLTTEIRLTADSEFIDIAVTADIKDPKIILKMTIPVTAVSDRVFAEIPYGILERSAQPLTPLDTARWEQCCQKFIGVYDSPNKKGIIIANNGKYGYDVRLADKDGRIGEFRPHAVKEPAGTVFGITLLRTPVFTGYAPETMFVNKSEDGGLDPTMPKFTDLEYHNDIVLRIIPYTGDNKYPFDNIKYAYFLNYPTDFDTAFLRSEDNGININEEIPEVLDEKGKYTFVKTNPSNVIISAIKISEDAEPGDTDDIVIRAVEICGNKTDATITFRENIEITEIYETDLTELRKLKSITPADNSIKITFEPYEIRTFRLRIKRSG